MLMTPMKISADYIHLLENPHLNYQHLHKPDRAELPESQYNQDNLGIICERRASSVKSRSGGDWRETLHLCSHCVLLQSTQQAPVFRTDQKDRRGRFDDGEDCEGLCPGNSDVWRSSYPKCLAAAFFGVGVLAASHHYVLGLL